jgi:hypothetical protein
MGFAFSNLDFKGPPFLNILSYRAEISTHKKVNSRLLEDILENVGSLTPKTLLVKPNQ